MVSEALKERDELRKSKLDPNFVRRKIRGQKLTRNILFIIATIIVAFGAFLMVFPYLWMFLSSLKTPLETVIVPPTIFPKDPNWGIFATAFSSEDTDLNLLTATKNTLVIEIIVIVVGTFVSTLCAFAFAKMRFKFKKTLLIILMTSMMIPYAAVMLPQYQVYQELGMVGSTSWFANLMPLILPGLFGNISMTFFLITSMSSSINDALIEEAKVEGCSWFRIYWSIALPLSRPAIAAQVIFWFVGIWNDYFAPSLYLSDKESRTLQVAVTLLSDSTLDYLPLMYACAFLSSIPTIIIFILCRKAFINMNLNSGVKG